MHSTKMFRQQNFNP